MHQFRNQVEEVDKLMQIDCTSSLHYLLLDTSFGRTLAYTANGKLAKLNDNFKIISDSFVQSFCQTCSLTIDYLLLASFYFLLAICYFIFNT